MTRTQTALSQKRGENVSLPVLLMQDSEYRRADLHSVLGGQRQGGISTPSRYPVILLFTGETGHQYGYQDGHKDDGYFHYTGEGQLGDMTITRGNAAICNHEASKKALYLFAAMEPRGMYRCLGQFAYADHYGVKMPDRSGKDRDGIVFRLRELSSESEQGAQLGADGSAWGFLKRRAAAIGSATSTPAERISRVRSLERSRRIRGYVVERANHFCEYCGVPAPFIAAGGKPYLEAHHVGWLSQEGEDHPGKVLALCPNCHREVHHGINAEAMTERMTAMAAGLEDAADRKQLVLVTAVVLMNAVGMVWLGQRRSDIMDGKWEFPGGKAEKDGGETLDECLRREIREELGVELGRLEPFTLVDQSYADKHIRLYVFISPIGTTGVKMTLQSHHKGLWYRLSDIPTDILANVDQEVVLRLKERFLVLPSA